MQKKSITTELSIHSLILCHILDIQKEQQIQNTIENDIQNSVENFDFCMTDEELEQVLKDFPLKNDNFENNQSEFLSNTALDVFRLYANQLIWIFKNQKQPDWWGNDNKSKTIKTFQNLNVSIICYITKTFFDIKDIKFNVPNYIPTLSEKEIEKKKETLKRRKVLQQKKKEEQHKKNGILMKEKKIRKITTPTIKGYFNFCTTLKYYLDSNNSLQQNDGIYEAIYEEFEKEGLNVNDIVFGINKLITENAFDIKIEGLKRKRKEKNIKISKIY